MKTENYKELTRRMIGMLGSRKDAAKLLDVSENDISQWCLPDHPRVIPLDHFFDLNALCDDIGLKELARVCGYELLPIDVTKTDPAKAIDAAADVIKDSADLAHDVIEAASDGVICTREVRELRGKMGEVYNGLHSLDGALQ